MSTHTLNIESLVDKAFLPVIRKRNILKVRLMTSKEKEVNERGGADIMAISPLGEEFLVTRDTLIENFLYLNGKKIKISAWKSGREYLVSSPDDTPAFAMMIPDNCNINISGRDFEPFNRHGNGQYIVCLADESENIVSSTASVISDTMFHKMFYMPRHSIIVQFQGSMGRSLSDKTAEHYSINKPKHVQNVQAQTRKTATGPVLHKDTSKVVQTQKVKPIRTQEKPVIKSSLETKPKFVVVAQLLNDCGQRVGFTIQADSGARKNIDKTTLISLCLSKKVANVEAVKKSEGTYFLRGNGISLDNLPTIDV